jgi:PKD repeat protein/sugar lactone lactonase YvrE/nitrous oxidase accessory protein NosD
MDYFPEEPEISFYVPKDVAVDSSGYIYVADTHNNRILKLSPEGEILFVWAEDLDGPHGIAVSDLGFIYVTNTWNALVLKFTLEGEYVTEWGYWGEENGQFNNPTGIAVDRSGNVYVADTGNHRIQKFSRDGQFLGKWGSEGEGAGQFSAPAEIDIDSYGNVYVVEETNSRVQKFNSDGEFLTMWGEFGFDSGQFSFPSGISVDDMGYVYVADTYNGRIQKFTSDGAFVDEWGTWGDADGFFSDPYGLTNDNLGNVYIADSGNNRIQKLSSDGQFIARWGRESSEDGRFYRPSRAAVDNSGNIYVTDTYNHRVQKFSPDGNFIKKWGTYGFANGQFDNPWGIAVDRSGNVYVSDASSRIQKFNSKGIFLSKWGSYGYENGQFDWIADMAIDMYGNIYVVDAGNSRIQKFTSNGDFITAWGTWGEASGEFDIPVGIDVDASGNVYVADAYNCRIQKFNSDGVFLNEFGEFGDGNGQFAEPWDVAVDVSGNIYVVDGSNANIQKFLPDGIFIASAGSWGFDEGLFIWPAGVSANDKGYVYVVDGGAHRIARFKSSSAIKRKLTELYVQQAFGDDANTGDGWGEGHSLNTIKRALELAALDPEIRTIHVAAGVYKEHLTLIDNVALHGGYPNVGGDPSKRNMELNPTVIDGDNTGRPVTIYQVSNAAIDGFTIQRGNTKGRGGGIYISDSSNIIISSNFIINNTATGDWGGGIAVAEDSADIKIKGNTIEGNKTDSSGGGISFWNDCTGEIKGNFISVNNAEEDGGGIIIGDCGVVKVSNNNISGNTAKAIGGGILIQSNKEICLLDGNNFYDNTATGGGGGICIDGSGATISDNSIKANKCNSDWGGGIRLYNANEVLITGNIIEGNSANGENGYGGGISFYMTTGGTLSKNKISGNNSQYGGDGVHLEHDTPPVIGGSVENCNSIYINGEYDLYNDTDDTVTANYNYWEVTNAAEIAKRINGSVLFKPWTDESCKILQAPVSDTGGPYAGNVDTPISFDGTGSHDPNGRIVSYAWDFGDGNTGNGEKTDHTYTVAGSYTVKLVVTDDHGMTGTDTTTVTVNEPEPATISILTPTAEEILPAGTISTTLTVSIANHTGNWQWKLNESFPTSGAADGNAVLSGDTTIIDGLQDGQSYTVYVALVDEDGDILSPISMENTNFSVNSFMPTHYEPLDDLVLYLDFENLIDGKLLDKSGKHNNGYIDVINDGVKQIEGKIGKALWFEGRCRNRGGSDYVCDYVNIPDLNTDVLDIENIYTIMIWVRFADISIDSLNTRHHIFLDKGYDDGNGWRIGKEANGGIIWQVSGYPIWSSVGQFIPDKWYHIAVTRDEGKTTRIYIDGNARWFSQEEFYNVPINDFDLTIGGSAKWSDKDMFNGTLDEIAIFKGTALNQNDIILAMENGVNRLIEDILPLPAADFSADPVSGTSPLTVNFTDLSQNNPTGWQWDFGDGETSDSQNPTHNYTEPGDYTVSLTVTNAAGSDTETKESYIHVEPALVPTITIITPLADQSFPAGTVNVVLDVRITDHTGTWRWKLNEAFPESGSAGGNEVVAGNTVTIKGLQNGQIYTLYVALSDDDGNMLDPSVTSSVSFSVEEPQPEPDFSLSALKDEISAVAGEFATYLIKIEGKNDFNSALRLFSSELPTGVESAFDPKEVAISPDEPLGTSQLTLTIPEEMSPGDYTFTILAVPDTGKTKELNLRLSIQALPSILTSVTLVTQPKEVPLKEKINVLGEIVALSEMPIDLNDLTISVSFTSPSEKEQNFESRTDSEGIYELGAIFAPDEVGEWTVRASFSGSDRLEPSERERTFNVTKGSARIVFDTDSEGALGTQLEILGRLEPQLEGELLSLKILRPDGKASTLTGIATEISGVFRYTLELDMAGDWEITATWAGNDQYQSSTEIFTISVSEEIGKVILVLCGGSENSNPAWTTFNRLAEYIRKILLGRRFDDSEDIYFLSPDPKSTSGADNVTSITALEFAITQWAATRVNARVPLYIYMISHNLGEQFLLEKREDHETYLTPAQLSSWVDQLPDVVQVTIIIEACYSGNFIRTSNGQPTPLVGNNRTIITSARGDKQANIVSNNLSSFSKIFFDRIGLNKTLNEAFSFTEDMMRRHPYHRDQFPQMDANGDGIINTPQDYAVVAQRYLPTNLESLAAPPEIIEVTSSQILPEGVSSLRISSRLLGADINRVFATVIPPDFDPERRIDDWSDLEFPGFDLARVSVDGEIREYAATYANFSTPGDYTIIINAENPDSSAAPVQTTITVPGGSVIKGDVNSDGKIRSNDAILTLRIAAGLMEPDEYQSQAADISGDGRIRSNDAILILRKAAGLTAPGITAKQIYRDAEISFSKVRYLGDGVISVTLLMNSPNRIAGGDICITCGDDLLGEVDISPGDETLLASAVDESGMLHIAFVTMDAINDSGLAEIRFKGDPSTLTFRMAELYDRNAVPIATRIINPVHESPGESLLLQNFPNPFNPETWIPYQLEKGGEIFVYIYNINGELVRRLDIGYKPSGFYTGRDTAAYWDGRNESGERVASGVYFYRICAGDFMAVKKLVILE